MTRKGFSMVEVMVVVIIIGVLASLGIVQYRNSIEKSYGGEAKAILIRLSQACEDIWRTTGSTSSCNTIPNSNNPDLGMGTTGPVPTSCQPTHYFRYSVSQQNVCGGTNYCGAKFRAERCTGGGKASYGTIGDSINLSVDNYSDMNESWQVNGPW